MNTIRFKPIPAQTIIDIVDIEDKMNESLARLMLIDSESQCLD